MEARQIIDLLTKYVTKERLETLNRVIDERTNYISVVLEDIFQNHNASAVLRSCDCFGIQKVNFIENRYSYMENKDVAMGSSQWLSIRRFNQKENNTLDAITAMREAGYRIVATTPHTNDVLIKDLDLSKGKIALFFGSEKPGLSDIVMDNADEFVRIPMYGFTESFNISVSAALCLYELTAKLRSSDIDWHLSVQERTELLAEWMKLSARSADWLIKEYEKRNCTVSDIR
ncbi:MAG: RNA methyltransferase [Bacteroidales bacterium]|nr:RNA methyltransferase [Bacteroidales bacterium]